VARTFRTANATSAVAAIDGDPATSWGTTAGAPPRSASLVIDLGQELPVGFIRWLVAADGFTGALRIDVSADRREWSTVATVEPGDPATWSEFSTPGVTARYVRFFVTNPEQLPAVGGLAEVEVLPPTST
jgi:hypothetical protein